LNFIDRKVLIQKKNNLSNYPALINHQLCGLVLSIHGEKKYLFIIVVVDSVFV